MEEKNIFISALDNYIKAKANEKEGYYMNSNLVNYKTLAHFIFTDMIICNNIVKYNDNWELELNEECEDDEYIDIYQYFIVDVDSWRFEKYKEYLQETNKLSDLTLWYDNELDIYILGVSHCGTSWEYVPTNIEIKKQEEE